MELSEPSEWDERKDGSHSDKNSNDLLKLMEISDKLNEVNFTWKVLFELNTSLLLILFVDSSFVGSFWDAVFYLCVQVAL